MAGAPGPVDTGPAHGFYQVGLDLPLEKSKGCPFLISIIFGCKSSFSNPNCIFPNPRNTKSPDGAWCCEFFVLVHYFTLTWNPTFPLPPGGISFITQRTLVY